MKKTSILGVNSRRFVGLHRTIHFSFFSITGQGIDLDYCDIEWFALERYKDHCVSFEIASEYCISDSFVDYDGYSIFYKGFLPTVISNMVVLKVILLNLYFKSIKCNKRRVPSIII